MLKYVALVAAIATTSAFAAPTTSPLYVTAGGGEAKFKNACDIQVGSCEDTDTTFRVGVGLQMQDNMSFEINYLDHGKATDNFENGAFFDRYSAEAQTIALQFSATAPVSEMMGLYGKVGLAHTQSTLSNQFNDSLSSGSVSEDGKETGLIVSAGIGLNFAPNLSAQFQLDYLPDAIKSDAVNFDTDIQSYSVGLKFNF